MDYEDIVPGLLKKIQEDFQRLFETDPEVLGIYEKVNARTATYKEANEFALRVGDILAEVFGADISSDILPDGKMYYNIAERIVSAMMKNNYDVITDVSSQVQTALNEQAGIGIKAIQPELNQDRIDGIVNKVSDAEVYDDVAWLLGEPIVNFSQSIVDDFIKANVDFQGKAGLKPRIIRHATRTCCEWCYRLDGVYSYPDVPRDVYRRHKNCRCMVDYDPGSGKKYQDVHTKEWKTAEERAKIQERKKIGIKSTAATLAEHPKRLASYTPEKLKEALEKDGFEVKPLKQGSLKNIPFEKGGGFKVNFEDGGILQYHPETKSHHGGAYYKISTGKGGRHRYDTDGNEKFD